MREYWWPVKVCSLVTKKATGSFTSSMGYSKRKRLLCWISTSRLKICNLRTSTIWRNGRSQNIMRGCSFYIPNICCIIRYTQMLTVCNSSIRSSKITLPSSLRKSPRGSSSRSRSGVRGSWLGAASLLGKRYSRVRSLLLRNSSFSRVGIFPSVSSRENMLAKWLHISEWERLSGIVISSSPSSLIWLARQKNTLKMKSNPKKGKLQWVPKASRTSSSSLTNSAVSWGSSRTNSAICTCSWKG